LRALFRIEQPFSRERRSGNRLHGRASGAANGSFACGNVGYIRSLRVGLLSIFQLKVVPTAFSSFRQRYRFAITLDAPMIVPIVIRVLPGLPNNGAQRRCCLCRMYGASCTVSTEIHLLLGAMIAFDHARARTLWLA